MDHHPVVDCDNNTLAQNLERSNIIKVYARRKLSNQAGSWDTAAAGLVSTNLGARLSLV